MSSDHQKISKSVLLINRIHLPTPISNISKYYDIPSYLQDFLASQRGVAERRRGSNSSADGPRGHAAAPRHRQLGSVQRSTYFSLC